MTIEKHDLLHEFPSHKETIHNLKITSRHFAKLFDQYHEVDHEVHRIEKGVENTSDIYLEEKKKLRLSLKDQLYKIIHNEESETA
ncbi:MAG: YdcH family protein [Sinobacterium sp.]|nr:YdcH family protein [Sinobacterium sp.]